MLTKIRQGWKSYGLVGASLALALFLTLSLEPLQDQRPYLVFFPAIMVCAWWCGLLLALGAIVLSAAAIHVWVLAPDPVWAVTLTESFQMGAFVVVAGGMSWALTAVVAAQTRFAVTLASIGDAVIVTDRQGRVTFLNDVAAALTGWAAPDAHGRDLVDIFPIINMHTRQAVENPVTRVLRAGHVVGLANHTVLLAKDGTEWPIDDSGAPVRTPAGDILGVVLVFRDVTARQRAEAELERRRQETALLAELAQRLSASLDLDTVLQRVITGAQELCGSERVLIALREPGADVLVGRYEIGVPYMAYTGLRIAPGQGLGGQVLRTGQPWRTADYAADLRFSKEYLAGAREAGHLAVLAVPIVMDGRVEGVLYASNPAAKPFTDRDEEILVRLAAHAAVALQNAQLYRQAQAELAERRTAEAALAQAAAELEQRVEERTAALHRAMAERQRLEQEAQRVEHFALLGRLAAGVSHEIRNPLGAVFLHVDLLSEEIQHPSTDSATAIDEALTEIKQQLARVEDLVEDYLSLVRVANLERTPQDLGTAVQGWATEWEPMAAACGVTLRCEGLETVGRVAVHPSTLRRALLNLVQNALDAMPQGGTLTLRGRRQGATIQLDIQDTGSGIPPEQRGRLLNRCIPRNQAAPGWGCILCRRW